RAGVIHNDGNDYNVLTLPRGKWGVRVSGVIDLGDMVHTRVVYEPAIVCAYAMMGKADPLAAARAIVAGYHEANPLAREELAVLFDLIRARLCMSVCHSANQRRLEPDNEYLRVSDKPAWDLLEKLEEVHPRFAHAVFRNACGLPPAPRSARIAEWLKEKSGEFVTPLVVDLNEKNVHVLDLGPGSDLPDLDWRPDDPASITHRIHREIRDAGAAVGVGRYKEARLFSPAVKFEFKDGRTPEQQNIHLGVDLFSRRNTPVFAFMDGKVHSFKNNPSSTTDTTFAGHGPTIILQHETDEGEFFYTLYGRLDPISMERIEPGDVIEKGERIGWIGDPKTNGGRPPHLHFQIIVDLLDETGDFPGSVGAGMADVWAGLCPDPNIILGVPESCFPAPDLPHEEILAFRRKNLSKNLVVSYDKPLKIVRGVGQYLFSDQGEVYLDGNNNVCHVGHCHPRVVEAGRAQMAVLNTNTRYLHDNIVAYARRLLSTFPDPLSVCYFVCTGSEANELAIRIARAYTGREDVITLDGAYHGNTRALIDVSPYKNEAPGGLGAPPWVHKAPMPDGYRGPHKGLGGSTGVRYAQYVREAADKIRAGGAGVSGFICESVLGCGGQVVLPEQYLVEAFRHVRAAGGVCIVDEVQVGFGRVGSHYWGFETQNAVPDIVTLGKPMGNGHPLAAVITTPELADAFANGMEYFNTFGGNPVSCAIGLAVLDVIEEEGLRENAREAGGRLLAGLKGLMETHPLIGDVRGLGLFAGVELVTDRETLAPAPGHASHIANRMKERGVLISTDGPLHNVLKIKPPIVFSEKNAEELVEALDRVLSEDCLQV
ncbi:MAG: aminotransferase class III-fold pyridoxal phosphate-dependent enzyme, partial [Desulfobacterales bacterium]|nr:aminotransferase class III-fold pyridoxal phosphate-dependent enzyme [Desulfobacterales bacterium]